MSDVISARIIIMMSHPMRLELKGGAEMQSANSCKTLKIKGSKWTGFINVQYITVKQINFDLLRNQHCLMIL